MIKSINRAVIAFFWRIRLRACVAGVLGACAGLSFTMTVLPTLLETVGVTDSFSARIDLAGLAIYSLMLWALGGWAAQKTPSLSRAGALLGLVGALSGGLFTGLVYAWATLTVLIGAAGGLAYGSVGGILIAYALAEPVPSKSS